jgi:hypothetical protein
MINLASAKTALSAAFSERDENSCAYFYTFPHPDKFVREARRVNPPLMGRYRPVTATPNPSEKRRPATALPSAACSEF